MSARPKHVCFYSKKCPYSKAFLEELAKTPYTVEFQFVCVDPAPNRPPLPKWLKSVPTLIIDGEAEPLTDEKVFNWLSFRRIQGSNTPAPRQQYKNFIEPPPPVVSSERASASSLPQYDPGMPDRVAAAPVRSLPEPIQTRSSPNQAAPQQQQVTSPDAAEPLAYHMAEMASGTKWSDSYSYIDEQFSIEKGTGNNRIERNFATLNPLGAASQEPSKPDYQSEKAKALNSAYDTYMKQRESDMPGPMARR